MHRIRCITFDLDDTLWSCQPVITEAERRFHGWLLERFPFLTRHYPDLETLIAHRSKCYQRYPSLHHDMTRLRKRWLEELAVRHALGDAWIEEGFRVFWLARNEVELYPEARQVLESLKSRFIIGAITNGNADVRHIGVDHYFDFVLTSAESGVAKPDPGMFFLALKKAGVKAHECLHVGDNLETDIQGARACGIHAVWVKADAQTHEKTHMADAVVRHVGELPQVLHLDGI